MQCVHGAVIPICYTCIYHVLCDVFLREQWDTFLLIWARRSLVVCDVNTCLYMTYCNFWILPGTPISTVSEDFSRLFENDQGGLWRLLWEVHLEEAVHQPCQIQIVLEDQSEKQAEGRTGNRSPWSKKSPAGRWTLFTLICDARNLPLPPSGVSYFIPVLCPKC